MGYSGQELDRIVSESGLQPGLIRYTNVCHTRPLKNKIDQFLFSSKKEAKERGIDSYLDGKFYSNEIAAGLAALRMEIASMPNLKLIIGCGNVPLWALTGNWGITNWRGSQIFTTRLTDRPIPFMPIIHPAAILRQWNQRWITVIDLKRAKRWMEEDFAVPKYNFVTRPSFAQVCEILDLFLFGLEHDIKLKLASDIETRLGHIACIGLATSPRNAICIPFLTVTGPYWSVEEECKIVWKLYQVLTHKNIEVIGQNYLYDQQYHARRWGFIVRLIHDTMLKQHLCFPGVSKGLDFISSLHCHFHRYWKEESKDWDPKLGEQQLWIYNCTDAVTTFEANDELDKIIKKFRHEGRLRDQMEDMDIALEMMLRGLAVDAERKSRVAQELEKAMIHLLIFCNKCVGFDLEDSNSLDYYEKISHFNPSSPKQVQSLVYDVLKLPVKWKQTDNGRRPTADKDAIKEWCDTVEPLFRPLIKAIADFRSLQVFRSTFALADLDHDGRWRCSINVAGPETFRWSTGADAFGFGTNMQNIPKGDEDE